MKFRQYQPIFLVVFFIALLEIAESVNSYLIDKIHPLIFIPSILIIFYCLTYVLLSGFNYIKINGDEVLILNFLKKHKLFLADIRAREERNSFIIEFGKNKKIVYCKTFWGLFIKGGEAVKRFREAFRLDKN